MASFFNLKSVFTADTSDLKKGSKEAKQAVKDFEDATTSALSDVTSLFGISMKEINTSLSTLSGAFLNFKAALREATAGATGFTRALRVLKTALVSTGIGAILVALGSLVAYFTKSQRGADQLRVVMDQLGQAFKVVGDWAIKVGEKIVNAFAKGFSWAKKLFDTVQFVTGKFNLGSQDTGEDNVFKRRYELTKRQIALEEKEIENIVKKAELENKISELRLKVEEKTKYTAQERLAFQNEAIRLTKELGELNMSYAQEELAILKENNQLSESIREDRKAEAEKEKEILNLQTQQNTQLKEMVAKQAELTNQINHQAEAEEKQRLAAFKTRKKEDLTVEKIDSSAILNKPFEVKAPEIPKQEFKEIESFLLDTTSIVQDFSNTISDAFASMIEGLVTGELNMRDIFNTILSFLAENLKAIGKALISYGMAMEGFKKAFSNPWVAIGLGAALVAAGAVLSGLVKNMSSGGGAETATPAAAYAAATVSGGNLDLSGTTMSQQKAQEVKVTGTIKASGRDLAIILENEKQRKNLVG